MITALMTTLFVGIMVAASGGGGIDVLGKALDRWESGIKKNVDDDAREEKALAVIDKAREDVATKNQPVVEAFTQFYEVDNNYHATLADYQNAIAEVGVQWNKVDSWQLDLRFEMKEILSADEWVHALGRVDKKTKKMDKTIGKNMKKAEKKHAKRVKKYEKKFDLKYEQR